jgi:hypothetical protein
VNDYYVIIAVSLATLVPVIYGVVFSFTYANANGQLNLSQIVKGTDDKTERMNLWRMIYLFTLNIISLLLLVRIATPVPSEGWLRTLFILTLLSAESVFVYLLIRLSCTRLSCIVILVLILLFMAAVPAGFVAHTPWNYLMFISPFYWLGWAWIIPSVGESISYAGIAIVLTVVYLLIANRLLKRRNNMAD